MRRELKNTKGITLIALVVTIIVLLILAGVTINAVFGENGLIKQVEIAKEKNTIASYQDEVDRALLAAKTICIAENRNGDILLEAKKELEQSTLFKDATFSEISNGEFTINTKDGYPVTVTENGATVVKKGKTIAKDPKVQILQYNHTKQGCVPSIGITAKAIKPIDGEYYGDAMEYYIKGKASPATKERMAHIYGCFYIIEKSSLDENAVLMPLLELVSYLKSENKTISQFIEEQCNTTTEDAIRDLWIEMDHDFDSIITSSQLFVLSNMEKQEETAAIISAWNKGHSSNQVTTIDEIVTKMYGEELTVKEIVTECECTEEVVLDYVYLMSDLLMSINSDDSKNKFKVIEEEYAQLSAVDSTAKIKLLDGTEKELTSDGCSIKQNGIYEIEITYDGKTEKYNEEVTEIKHKNMQEESGYTDIGDGTHTLIKTYSCGSCGETYEEKTIQEHSVGSESGGYEDNGDGTHSWYRRYTCMECGANVEEKGTPETHNDGGTSGVIEDNGDGTHSWTRSYTCMECGASVEEKGTPEPHGNKSYVPNNDGTHSIRCGDAPENGCGADLGTEACTDTNGDGRCDFCSELIPTGE